MVLHFAERPTDALAEAARVIAPGGCLMIADFAPHEHEELRERHAHRRLGFRRQEVEIWADAAGLDTEEVRELAGDPLTVTIRSEEHTSELQSLMRISYAVFCLKK